MMKLERMPPAVRARLKHIEIRCPVKGCLLATFYRIPRSQQPKSLRIPARSNTTQGADEATECGCLDTGTGSTWAVPRAAPRFTTSPSTAFPVPPRKRPSVVVRAAAWSTGGPGAATAPPRWNVTRCSISSPSPSDGITPWETEEEEFARLPEDLQRFWASASPILSHRRGIPECGCAPADREDLRPLLPNSAPLGGR